MKENILQTAPPSINCKRQVLLKSIVTNDFKIDLAVELKEAVDSLKSQIVQIGNIAKQQKEKGFDVSQIENEQRRLAVQMKLMQDRLDEVKHLKEGDLYTTGSVECYTPLRVGDDIREKLDSVEVISKNYIIQEINVVRKTINQAKHQISKAIPK